MMRCAGTKRDSSPCTASVEPPARYCWWHDPKHAEQRKRAASRGGSSRPSRELRTLKADLKELIARVDKGELEPTRANTMIRAHSVLKDFIALERQIRADDELEARIVALERASEAKKGVHGPWRA